MKNFNKTLALAAVAAVSMFSAQSAKAQIVSVPSTAFSVVEDDEPELTAASTNNPFMDFLKDVFVASLKGFKMQVENGRVLTKEEIQNIITCGAPHGYTEAYIRAYLGLPAA